MGMWDVLAASRRLMYKGITYDDKDTCLEPQVGKQGNSTRDRDEGVLATSRRLMYKGITYDDKDTCLEPQVGERRSSI